VEIDLVPVAETVTVGVAHLRVAAGFRRADERPGIGFHAIIQSVVVVIRVLRVGPAGELLAVRRAIEIRVSRGPVHLNNGARVVRVETVGVFPIVRQAVDVRIQRDHDLREVIAGLAPAVNLLYFGGSEQPAPHGDIINVSAALAVLIGQRLAAVGSRIAANKQRPCRTGDVCGRVQVFRDHITVHPQLGFHIFPVMTTM